MSISLKDVNRPALAVVVAANVLLYYALLSGQLRWEQFVALMQNYENYLPAALLSLLVGILNSQLDHTFKARLIFWRWHHPLPGSCAFTKIAQSDTRIDLRVLETIASPLPTDPADQNRLWFKWYRQFQDEPGIKQVHREYLFARDWAGLAVLLSTVLVPLAFWQMPHKVAVYYLAGMIIQYLLVRWSARNHGVRFVASVLAYKSVSMGAN